MKYLFETEHFLIRKKTDKNNPHALLVEFRSTGTPVGEVMIKTPADSFQAEVSCHLYKGVYKGFQKSRFEAEIVNTINALL